MVSITALHSRQLTCHIARINSMACACRPRQQWQGQQMRRANVVHTIFGAMFISTTPTAGYIVWPSLLVLCVLQFADTRMTCASGIEAALLVLHESERNVSLD